MKINPFLSRFVRAPENGAGAGAAAADDNAPPADPPPGDGAGNPPPASWWSGLDADTASFVKAKGLDSKTEADALKATLGMYRSAEQMLGKKGIPLPEKGTDTAAWLAQNREALGIPKDATGYEVKIPEGFDEATWDKDLADKTTAMAAELGVPPAMHQRYVETFAGWVKDQDKAAAEAGKQAEAEMTAALEKDWGKDTRARVTAARQAAQRWAEEAGLDRDGLQLVSADLTDKIGPAATIRLFDVIARATADDTIPNIVPGGGGGMPSDAASAQAELEKLRGKDGEYFKAVQERNMAEVKRLQPKIDQLTAIVAAAQKKR